MKLIRKRSGCWKPKAMRLTRQQCFTRAVDESKYILRFYNQEKIVGKIYLYLNDCAWIETKPFTLNVKFGGLTDIGQKTLETMLHDKKKWE